MTYAHTMKRYWTDKNYLWLAFASILFLLGSLVVNWNAGIYATESASNSVTDIILSNIPVFDVDGLFVWATFVFWGYILWKCIYEPKVLPYVFKSVALFVVIRAVFVSLTHIGPFPSQLVIDSRIMSQFAFAGDLFFSGHTGLPFLMALIFWDRIYQRILFILAALGFGTLVLLAHLHYSIDVLAAFFITFTIHHIATKVFKREHHLFTHGIDVPHHAG